ncbi:MAG: hypothetical protein HY370_02905 [Proteobacteria bacterium]|nr:hypothetical protein [Pseudomonadota bacterium]
MALGIAFHADAANGVRHEKLKKAGVLIPISNPRQLPDGKLEFDVYAQGISKFNYLWAKMWGNDFGYYLEGTSKDKNRVCPYFEKRDKTYFKNEVIQSMLHYKVTLGLPDHMMREIIDAQCAISPEPDDDAAPPADNDNNRNASGKAQEPPVYRAG